MAVRTHSEMQCDGQACVVHSPSDHHMKEWPIVYRIDRAVEMPGKVIGAAVVKGAVFVLAERTCPHGIGHPDPDSIGFARREGGNEFAGAESVHGCDGCCRDPRKPITAQEVEQLKKFVDAQPADDGDKDLEELLAGPFHFLPDDHPHVVAQREKFNQAMDEIDARGPQPVRAMRVRGADVPIELVLAEDEEEDGAELAAKFDQALASGEPVTLTAPPPGWLGPIRVPLAATVTWRSVTQRAMIPWDEPIFLALTPRQKMDGIQYPVVLGYFDGDSFVEYSGTSLDGEVTHWADAEYPTHPARPVR